MQSPPPRLPPSPFAEKPPMPKDKVSGEPYRPLTAEELAIVLDHPPELRGYDPYRCMFDWMAEDHTKRGANRYDGGRRQNYINPSGQCLTKVADPTRSRYCREHARQMGVDYYDPSTETELSVIEGEQSLYSHVGASIATMLEVMQDPDTPAGVRAKTAEAILDRTGFVRGVKVQAEVKVEDSGIADQIRERLEKLATVTPISEAPSARVIEGDVTSGG